MQFPPFTVGSPIQSLPSLVAEQTAVLRSLDFLLDDADAYRLWFTNLRAAKEAARERWQEQEFVEAERRSRGLQTSELLHVEEAGPVKNDYRVTTRGKFDYRTFQATRTLTRYLNARGQAEARELVAKGSIPAFLGSSISVNLFPLVRTGAGEESWVLTRRSPKVGIFRGFVAPFSEGVEACDANLAEAVSRGLMEELGIREPKPSRAACLTTSFGPFGCDTGVAVIVKTNMTLSQLTQSIQEAHDGKEASQLLVVPLGADLGQSELTMPWTRRMLSSATDLVVRENGHLTPRAGADYLVRQFRSF